ncbi:MAG: hypothetical protein KAF27_01845 [Porphyrobacter sp.]|nr:hypothetical protein [Porphyrobacter sp.]
MNGRAGSIWLSAALLALTLAGCGAADAPISAAAPVPEAQAEGRAEQLAEALLLADRAEARGDPAALAEAALRLDRLAPRAQTEADAAAQDRWRTHLPADAAPFRGRALGPAWRSVALQPGAMTQLNQTFLGGRAARIVVKVAEGSTPRLMVRDQTDREVCRAEQGSVTCRWLPLYTQRHRIEIVNSGRAPSRFYVVFD